MLENNLKKYRFNHNQLTQEKLAEQLGVSRQTVIAIEKRKSNPSVMLALKMAKLFECQVENLFYLKET